MRLPTLQTQLFQFEAPPAGKRLYQDALTVQVNRKGVVDVDTVKGCTAGMKARPGTGCYGECYANKIAERLGIDFATSVTRGFVDHRQHIDVCINQLIKTGADWYRIGVMGDPCHDWNHTLNVIHALRHAKMVAVIITKHWMVLSDSNISRMKDLSVVVNTSTSGLDTNAEFKHRVHQIERLRRNGIPSVNRVITCEFSDTTQWARDCAERQRALLAIKPMIDNPLRVSKDNPRVLSGEIKATRRADSVGGGKLVSVHSEDVYLGHCGPCPDQCAAGLATKPKEDKGTMKQQMIFGDEEATDDESLAERLAPAKKPRKRPASTDGLPLPANVSFVYAPSVIGSGYEAAVAKLALEDGIAHRAARKNMQIHSAIILLVAGEFGGFFTFQNNHTIGEFCLLQSVIRPDLFTFELYRNMASEVIKQNTAGYPMLMTTNPKSKFETPECFEGLGFSTYLKMSGFEYMLSGDPAYMRMKVLAHITMTNVWNSVKGDWLNLKKEWNTHIELAGAKAGIPNPTFATREGCWQGESGFANVVTGRAHNGNASVLDPVACETIARFFMPKGGGRIYNPFGGGVQMGFVSGASGYEYLATEIRQNQCDANNALCAEYKDVKWERADSSKYKPKGKFDLVFTCPPYYRVERYLDADGKSPDGEINSLDTYEEFRARLFAGYEKAIKALKENRFFVVMTGDSRDKRGAYHCHEAETEIFLKEQGLSVYNKIVYLEAEFTRLAQAKKTLHVRKFPKREQKIIVAYKGTGSGSITDAIAKDFASIGRL